MFKAEISRKLRHSGSKRLAPYLLLATYWLIFFWPIVSGLKVVLFRDSLYWYYPLYYWVHDQFITQQLPLWNPYENFGSCPLADPTSALLYPGKLLFLLPGTTFTYRFGIYSIGHVLLAGWGGIWLAKCLGTTSRWSLLAGLSYAFSGTVLFQSTNLVFLIGATWLPWSLGAFWKSRKQFSMSWGCLAAAFVSLMILGGDLQMAFVTLLVIQTTLCWDFLRHFLMGPTQRKKWLFFSANFCLIPLATISLSAVQLVPSWHMAWDSDRHSEVEIQNVWQAIIASRTKSKENPWRSLAIQPEAGSHGDAMYQFSQPPWMLSELLWPNISGRLYPTNSRWVDGIPAADRMWHVSLYQSYLIVIMAIWGCLRQRRPVQGWILVWSSLFLLASFGWYGPVWLLREFGFIGNETNIANPVGGVYWWMVKVIPGFDLFRYPAKLFPWVTLGLALLGARSARNFGNNLGASGHFAIALLIALPGLLLLPYPANQIEFLARQQTDVQFGPVRLESAQAFVCGALVFTSAFSVPLLFLKNYQGLSSRHRNWLSVSVIALDLWLANVNLLPMVSQTLVEASRQQLVTSGQGRVLPPVEMRISTEVSWPEHWAISSSSKRLEEIVAFVITTGQTRFNLVTQQWRWGVATSLHNRYLANLLERTPAGGPNLLAILDQPEATRESPRKVQVLANGQLLSRSPADFHYPNASAHRNKANLPRELPLTLAYQTNAICVTGLPSRDGTVVLPVAYDPYWIAESTPSGAPLPVTRCDNLFCGVTVSESVQGIRLYRKPLSRRWEFWVSVSTVCGMAFFLRIHPNR